MMTRIYQISVKMLLVVALMTTILFSVSPTVQAGERTCSCYCAVPTVGATDTGGKSLSDCQEYCADRDWEVAAWACSADQLPSRNTFCFTETQCSEQGGNYDSEQPAECHPGMHYCYPDPDISVDLNVLIGDLAQVEDLGQYMEAVYAWLIGASTLFAIVMILIGGLQYSMAASSGQTSNAKKRILNGVVGLTLLLGAYLVLYTVNPQLVKLQVPTFPMIRQVALASGDSCGYLTGYWGTQPYHTYYGAPQDSPYTENAISAGSVKQAYVLENPTDGTNCGSVAEVVEDENGNEVLSGTTCTFDYCEKEDGVQLTCVGSGDAAGCVKCEDIVDDNEWGVVPSESMCSQFSRTPPASGGALVENNCYYAKRGAYQPAAEADNFIQGSCVMVELDCSKISSCSDYENVVVRNSVREGSLDELTWSGQNENCAGTCGNYSIKDACDGDPCNVAGEGKKCFADNVNINVIDLLLGVSCDEIDE